MKRETSMALITVMMWSTLAPAVKLTTENIPTMQMLCITSGLAFLFLLFYNGIRNKLSLIKKMSPQTILKMAGLGFLGLFLYSALYYYGIDQLTSSEACILNYLWPLMTVIFSGILLHEPMTAKKIVSMLLSFLGIVILSLGGEHGSGNAVLGILACILAAACYGLFSVLNKKEGMDQGLTMMVIWLTTSLCAALCSLFGKPWVPVHGLSWAGLIWIGVFLNAVAYLLWALAINGTDSTAAIANLAYLVPLLSMILSILFLHEPLKLQLILALVLIVGGILLQNLPSKKPICKREIEGTP